MPTASKTSCHHNYTNTAATSIRYMLLSSENNDNNTNTLSWRIMLRFEEMKRYSKKTYHVGRMLIDFSVRNRRRDSLR